MPLTFEITPVGWLLAISGAFNAFVGFATLIFVLRNRNENTHGAIPFAIMSGLLGVWGFFYTLWQFSAAKFGAIFFLNTLMIPAGFLGPLFLTSAVRFARTNITFLQWALYLLATLHAVGCLIPGIVVHDTAPIARINHWPIAGPFFVLFVITFTLGFGIGIGIFTREAIRDNGMRAGSRVALITGMVGGLIGGAMNIPAWYANHWPSFALTPWLTGLCSTFLIIPAAVIVDWPGLKKLRPSTVRVVAEAFVVIIGAIVVWMAGFFVIESPDHILPQLINPATRFAIAIIASVIFVVFGERLVRLIEGMFTGQFSPEAQRVQSALVSLADILNTIEESKMGPLVARKLKDAFHVSRVAIYALTDRSDALVNISADPAQPLSDPLTIPLHSALATEAQRSSEPGVIPKDSPFPGYRYFASTLEHGELRLLILLGERTTAGSFGPAERSALSSIGLQFSARLRVAALARQEAANDQLLTLGIMAGSLAHEFKNPLTSVTTYIGLPHTDRELDEFRKVAQVDLQRMVSVVESVLAFSDTNKLQASRVDIATLIRSTIQLTQTPVRINFAQLVTDVPEGLFINGHPGMVQTILVNLVSNAANAIGKLAADSKSFFRGTIFLKAFRQSAEVWITVSDTGPGVPKEVEPRLFAAFNTSDRSSAANRKNSGHGIGLASVRRLVQYHGGKVWYEPAKDGQPHRFCVVLKFADAP